MGDRISSLTGLCACLEEETVGQYGEDGEGDSGPQLSQQYKKVMCLSNTQEEHYLMGCVEMRQNSAAEEMCGLYVLHTYKEFGRCNSSRFLWA